MALRLGDGVPGEGPHHRAARVPAGLGRRRERGALLWMLSRREGSATSWPRHEARRRAPRRRRGGVRDLHGQERLAPRPRSPRALGGDARHLHGLDGHPRDGAGGVPGRAGAARPHQPVRPRAGRAQVAGLNGRRNFEDSLGAHLPTRTLLENLTRTLSAATGWEYSRDEAMRFGRRIGAIFRAFNLRCGIGGELERPSKRYGSTPVDGPAKGQSIEKHWEQMLDLWYEGMGYDRASGRPTPDAPGRRPRVDGAGRVGRSKGGGRREPGSIRHPRRRPRR